MTSTQEFWWGLRDQWAAIGEAIIAGFERQQIEWVFGLTGGELADEPLHFRDEDGTERKWAYHYDDVPEWAADDFDTHEGRVSFCTLIEAGVSYSSCAPEIMNFGTEVWHKVATYAASGETECPERQDQELVGEGHTEGLQQCPLCEADAGEEHGFIYVGESAEHVYMHVDMLCAICEVSASEIAGAGAMRCDCDIFDSSGRERNRDGSYVGLDRADLPEWASERATADVDRRQGG